MSKNAVLQNKRIFITGCSKGIGLRIAKKLTSEGVAAIGICSSRPEHLSHAREILTTLSGNTSDVFAFDCDVTDAEN